MNTSENIERFVKIPASEWKRIVRILDNLEPKNDWVDKDEAMRLLKCSRAKLHILMNDGKIEYTTGGGRSKLYSRQSIMNYLEENSTK